MGIYLNSSSAFGLFRRDCLSTYFIDKSSILKELVPLVESDDYDPEKTVLNSQNSQNMWRLPDRAGLEKPSWPI